MVINVFFNEEEEEELKTQSKQKLIKLHFLIFLNRI